VRRPAAARTVAEDIRVSTGNDAVEVKSLDVSDLASVRRFCADWTGPLQILINNAGIMALQDLHRTPEGWEMRFATNFLGHFALTTGLHAALAAASGTPIVSVSSSANMMAPVFFDDPNFNFIPYNLWLAYGQSKTATPALRDHLLRKHVDRDPPEMVSRICGAPHDKYLQVCKLFATTAAPDKALTCPFALGWT
jgi:NAD(P)-dependent dehydrogenase (short-subunit alcohol dehydrogenase family)